MRIGSLAVTAVVLPLLAFGPVASVAPTVE